MSAKRIILAGGGKTSEHQSGKLLADVLGRRKDEVFLELKALLETFEITGFYTNDWGGYERHKDSR